jgi:hypothetical protein
MSEFFDVRLETPETTLSALSFVETDTNALSQWIANLPLANIAETGNQLKLATAELALLRASPNDKFELLETVRPLLHYICTRLDRSLFTAPKSANEPQAQRLLLNLCTSYKSVVLDTLTDNLNRKSKDKLANKELLASAVHRLISDLSRILLRAMQLYVSPPANLWWELNELYRLSEALGLCEFSLADEENDTSQALSIRSAYLRALLTASSKPNQLNHLQLSSVFNALELWTGPVTLEPGRSDALLIVDLMANTGPQYAKLARDMLEPRGLHTEVLAYEIEAYLNDVESHFDIPSSLDRTLLHHLVDAWSVMQERTFGRFTTDAQVRVAVGLRAAHYFLSGGCNFTAQLTNTDELLRREVNPFLDLDYEPIPFEDSDPWSHAHDIKTAIPLNPNVEHPEQILLPAGADDAPKKAAELRSFVHYETVAVDTSPGGYRMEWLDEMPPNAKVGELVALREEQSARWCVAVIRWIRQSGERISMGVELLSPRAIPVAVRVIRKKGGPTDFARALILPQIEALKQAATLITPSVPFLAKQKIQIQRQGLQTTGQLLESRKKTESVNQFTFRMLDGYLENTRSDSNIDNLDAMTREDTTLGP